MKKYLLKEYPNQISFGFFSRKTAITITCLLCFIGISMGQPSNDDPCNAISLTANTSCSYATYTNAAATASVGVPAPGCASYSGGDVWFKVTVPAIGILAFDTQTGVVTDGGMAIYSGTCGSLTLISCDDDSSPNGLMPKINASGLTPGDTIWVRVWEYGNNNNGTFSICASYPPPMPSCSGNAPAGNTACLATPICDLNGYCGNTSSSYTANYWAQLNTAFCGSIENNSFISFVASASTISFNVWVTSSSQGFGIQIFIFSAASCSSGSVTGYTCYNPGNAAIGANAISATGLTPGASYYIMIDGNSGDVCNYVIGTDGNSGIQIPVAVTPTTATFCIGDSVSLTASGGNGTYTWAPSTGLSATSGTTVMAVPTAIGTTTYTVTSTTGNVLCPTSTTATAALTVNSCGCIATASNSGPVCPSGTFDLSASTVAGATDYSWTGPSGYTSNTQNPTGIIASAIAGTYTYTLTVTTATNSCTATTTVTVNPDASIVLTSAVGTNAQTLCINTAITPTTYSISGGGTGAVVTGLPAGVTASFAGGILTISGTPTGSGTFNDTITTTGTCAQVVEYGSIIVDPLPVINTTNILTSNASCGIADGTITGITASGTGTLTYTWSDNIPTIVSTSTINADLTGQLAGSYTLLVTSSSNSCSSTAGPFSIGNTGAPAAPIPGNNSPVCEGSQLNLTSDNIAGATYHWTGPNGFTSSAEDTTVSTNSTPAMVGTYSVTVTLGGCISLPGITTVVINTIPATPNAGSNSPVCEGSQLDLTSNTIAGATYSWSGPNGFTSSAEDTTVSINSTTAMAGTYAVTATLSGCTSLAGTTTVVINTIPSAPNSSSNSPVCVGSQLNLTSNTIAGATYSWTGPNGFTSAAEDPTVSTNSTTAMAGTYSVTVTVASCTSLPGTTSVVINTIPSAPSAASNSPVCEGSQLDLTSNSIAGASYSWTGPNGFTSSAEDTTVSINSTTAMAGTYSVTATVSGCTSLSGTTTVVINTIPSAPNASSNSPVCLGSQLDLTSNNIAGASYSWTGPNGFTSSAEDTTVSANSTNAMAGTYSVTATVAGCTSLAGTTTVIVNSLPSAPIPGSNSPVCIGSPLNLNSNTIAGATYNWTGPNGFTSSSEDPTVSSNSTLAMSGTYSVTVTVAGCTSIAGTTNVTVNSLPATPIADSNSPICEGSPLDLTTNPVAGATYNWTGPNGFTSSVEDPTVSSNSTLAMAGTYSLTITVGGCTSLPGTTSVLISPMPIASFTTSPNPASGTPPLVVGFTNTSQNATTYLWMFGDGTTSTAANPPSNTYLEGTYTVELTASDNTTSCTSTTSVIVIVYPVYSIVVPNVFTPNGDSKNDIFAPITTGVSAIDAEIFDRWGLKIAEWQGVSGGWNGRSKSGAEVKDGTYYYVIKVTASDGHPYEYKGYITLLK